jgi:hypothetical protein
MCHNSFLPYLYFHSHSLANTINLYYVNSAIKLARINRTQAHRANVCCGLWISGALCSFVWIRFEDRGSPFVQNVGLHLQDYTVSQPKTYSRTVIVIRVFPLYIRPDCLNLIGAAGCHGLFRVLEMLHEGEPKALYSRNHTTDTLLQNGLSWVKSSWFCYVFTDKCRGSAFEYFSATYLQIFNHSQFIVRCPFHSPFCSCIQALVWVMSNTPVAVLIEMAWLV